MAIPRVQIEAVPCETCPRCGFGSVVVDSRPAPTGRRRKRRCVPCDVNWVTLEVVELEAPPILEMELKLLRREMANNLARLDEMLEVLQRRFHAVGEDAS